MKHLLGRIINTIIGLAIGGVVLGLMVYASRPWYLRLGATDAEIAAALPGDEIVTNPAVSHNSGITIQAPPERIYPWLVQLGAERGGYYSFMPIEGLLNCPINNADSIHPEWQNLKVGDEVKMCPGTSGPPPYTVASLEPNRSVILGHKDPDGTWQESWQFVLSPIDDHSTRLLLRGRSALSGGIWAVIEPGAIFMEQGLLNGVKTRAEQITTGKSVTGKVLYGTTPVAGATVYLGTGGWKMRGNDVLLSAVTDATGVYTLANPPVGDYILVAVWPDGTPSEGPVSRAQVWAGADLPDVTVTLAKKLDWLEPTETNQVQATPRLRWGSLDGVTQYRIQVIDAGTTELVLDQTVTTTSLSLSQSLTLGQTYDVVVNGLDTTGSLLGTVTQRFTVRSEP